MSASPVVFGITKWFTWALRPIPIEADQVVGPAVSLLAVVSYQRLLELAPLMEAAAVSCGSLDIHQLLRFNLLNLGEDPATVCAIALRGNGAVLGCEIAPSVVVQAGARYPFMFEVTTRLVSEAVDVQVEGGTGEGTWVSASCLPSP
jgi:hypothetical protein